MRNIILAALVLSSISAFGLVELKRGQSFVLCKTDVMGDRALSSLNNDLSQTKVSMYLADGAELLAITAPFSVSSPAVMASKNTDPKPIYPEVFTYCVTVTKQ